jgi:hypothetical protein
MQIKKNIAISDSGYIFNPGTGESFVLNPIAKEILELLKENKSYEEISAFITDQYNISGPTFEKDYFDFMNTLRKNHLIEDEDND